MAGFKLIDAMNSAKSAWQKEASALLLVTAKKYAPVDTGKFKDSLYSISKNLGLIMTTEIRSDSNKPEAIWVTQGTQAHDINAVNAQSMMWQEKTGGDVIFATSVRHPGAKPSDMSLKTITELSPVLTELMAAKLKEQFEE